MMLTIPATRWTREMHVSTGRNSYNHRAFGFTAHDDVFLFVLAMAFVPGKILPTIRVYNGRR